MIRFALIVASTLGFVLTAALGNLMTPLLRAFRVQQEENEPPTMGGLCLMVGTLAAVGVGWTAACVAQPELLGTESLLTTLRAYDPHRLVVVFGCGGNRSKLRRYGMGEICAKMADFSILTEDNNRFEKVEDILADIRVGMEKGNPDAKFVEIPDRLDALHYAVDHAQEGDLIAVIGKGHETYRDREGVKTPFLERELLEEYAQQKGLE